jgi:hypothetical protein
VPYIRLCKGSRVYVAEPVVENQHVRGLWIGRGTGNVPGYVAKQTREHAVDVELLIWVPNPVCPECGAVI